MAKLGDQYEPVDMAKLAAEPNYTLPSFPTRMNNLEVFDNSLLEPTTCKHNKITSIEHQSPYVSDFHPINYQVTQIHALIMESHKRLRPLGAPPAATSAVRKASWPFLKAEDEAELVNLYKMPSWVASLREDADAQAYFEARAGEEGRRHDKKIKRLINSYHPSYFSHHLFFNTKHSQTVVYLWAHTVPVCPNTTFTSDSTFSDARPSDLSMPILTFEHSTKSRGIVLATNDTCPEFGQERCVIRILSEIGLRMTRATKSKMI